MNLNQTLEGKTLTMEFEGVLDTLTSPILAQALDALDGDIQALWFDFSKLDYISSAGLREVVRAYKWISQRKGSFRILHANDRIKDIFRVTGLSAKIEV